MQMISKNYLRTKKIKNRNKYRKLALLSSAIDAHAATKKLKLEKRYAMLSSMTVMSNSFIRNVAKYDFILKQSCLPFIEAIRQILL